MLYINVCNYIYKGFEFYDKQFSLKEVGLIKIVKIFMFNQNHTSKWISKINKLLSF